MGIEKVQFTFLNSRDRSIILPYYTTIVFFTLPQFLKIICICTFDSFHDDFVGVAPRWGGKLD